MSAVIAEAFQHGGLWLFRTFQELPPLTDGPTGQMQVALSRRWEAGPTGDPLELNAHVFSQMIENFNAMRNRAIPVDIDHRAFNKQLPSSEAAGWVRALSQKDGPDGPELWATVEWTPETAAKIKSGAWKFCSPAFSMNFHDRESDSDVGPKLLTVSLTNVPFQDGLQPIKLSMIDDSDAAMSSKPDADKEPDPGDPNEKKEPAEMSAVAGTSGIGANGTPIANDASAATDPTDAEKQNTRIAMMETLLDRIAKAANISPDAALAALIDESDAVATHVAARTQRDGTAAETRIMSMPNPEEKKPETAAGAATETDAEKEARLKALEEKGLRDLVISMSQRMDEYDAREKARTEQAAAAHTKRIKDEVESRIQGGFIEEKDREDAIYFFTQDWERADRNYSRKVVALGQSQAGAEPDQRVVDEKAKARADELALDPSKATEADLTKDERVQMLSMVQSGYPKDQVVATLITRRAAREAAQSRITMLAQK